MTTVPQPESQSNSASQSPAGAQSISISAGSNSGSIQAVNAGRDAVVSQAMGQGEAEEISQADAVALLEQVVALIRAAELPESEKEEAEMYAKLAKKEAGKEEPDKKRIIGNLEGATGLLKRLSGTAEAGKKLVEQLKGPIATLAGWLGVAAVHFLG